METNLSKKPLALIVDDSEMNREILADMLEEEFEVVEAENGKEAIRVLFERMDEIAVMLLDLIMPGMSGIEVLRFMKTYRITNKIPVIVISGENSVEVETECFDLGAFEFLHKPYQPVLVNLRIRHATSLMNYRNHLEEMVEQKTAEIKRMNDDIIELLGTVVEARSLESGQHVRRVKFFTRCLANSVMRTYPEYDLTPHWVETVSSASALHDVGKVMISDSVLNKPGKLTPEEFETMKKHTIFGCTILESTPTYWARDYYDASYAICRHHHEKYDGKGYPDGLVGDEIPLEAQIVSVADCFDALTTERVYKKAFSVDKAYEMILGGECGSFNPDILDCFVRCRDDFERMVKLNPAVAGN